MIKVMFESSYVTAWRRPLLRSFIVYKYVFIQDNYIRNTYNWTASFDMNEIKK